MVPRSLQTGDVCVFDQQLAVARFIALTAMTMDCFVLMFIAMQLTPLVFAPLNGIEVVGAHFHMSTHRRLALTVAQRWADRAIRDTATVFLVGEYAAGGRLIAAPLDLNPPAEQVVRTPAQRRRLLQSGVTAAWCTVAALAGTIAYDAAARSVAACAALRCPVPNLADATALGHRALSAFSIGVFSTRPMVDRLPDLPVEAAAPTVALGRMHTMASALMRRLRDAGDDESLYWADVIRPEELQDVPPGFLEALPTF